jgi:hypothetical protein
LQNTRAAKEAVFNVKTACGVCVVAVLAVMSCSSSRASAQTIQPIKHFYEDSLEKPRDGTGKTALAYKVSQWYLRGATGLDMSTTVIGMNYAHGIETGWARYLGNRNTSAVVMANVGLNIGTELLSRKLYHRGGSWRTFAIALNVLKGTGNAVEGVRNIRYLTEH